MNPFRHPLNVGVSQPQWLRLSTVALRWGISPRALAMDIDAQRLAIRPARFGERGIVHLATADVLAVESQLNQEVTT